MLSEWWCDGDAALALVLCDWIWNTHSLFQWFASINQPTNQPDKSGKEQEEGEEIMVKNCLLNNLSCVFLNDQSYFFRPAQIQQVLLYQSNSKGKLLLHDMWSYKPWGGDILSLTYKDNTA